VGVQGILDILGSLSRLVEAFTALSELNDIRENIFRGEETRHFLSWNCVVTLSTAERSFCDNLCLSKRK